MAAAAAALAAAAAGHLSSRPRRLLHDACRLSYQCLKQVNYINPSMRELHVVFFRYLVGLLGPRRLVVRTAPLDVPVPCAVHVKVSKDK